MNLPPLVIKSNFTFEFIKRVNEIKFLGVYYDHKLTFKHHINHLTQRLSRTCALIYRVRELMPTFVLKNMFHAHVGSVINYCNIVWANTSPTNLQPLILILKRIIRNVSHSEFLAHTAPIYKRLKILDLESTRKQGTRGEHTSAYGIRIVSAFGLWLTHSIRYPNWMTGWISGPSRD